MIFNPRVVDRIALDKKTRGVVLYLLDAMDWSDVPEHLARLQEKMNTYIAFLESGEMRDRYPQLAQSLSSVSPRLSVIFKVAPPKEAEDFISYARTVLREAGFVLETETRPLARLPNDDASPA